MWRQIRSFTSCRLLLAGLALLTACAGANTRAPVAADQTGSQLNGDEPLKVVATWSILSDLIRNVGGDKIDLRTLVPASGDAHTFEPSPSDGVALAGAALVFENGLGFEP